MSTATIVGGGPAGLIAAEILARAGVRVTVYDQMPSVGRKFLMAGHGGLNITHSEELPAFLGRYGESAGHLAPALAAFSPADLRSWCAGLGEETFVGSSRRVFPRSFRANALYRAWLARLSELGVTIVTKHRLVGWVPRQADEADVDGQAPPGLRMQGADGEEFEVSSDVVILALGGGSWPSLGSDGSWTSWLEEGGIAVSQLRSANVGLRVDWTARFATGFAGTPVKHLELGVRDGEGARVRGDAMITQEGIEGGPIYALGAPIRRALDSQGECWLELDLRPDLPIEQLVTKLQQRRPKDSSSSWLRRSAGLDAVSISLLWEANGSFPATAAEAAALIKSLPVVTRETMPMERAISTAGGVAWSEVDENLMLRAVPGTFVAGEMLDWEAPTGGYLLQASFSTGVVAANGALARLGRAEAKGSVGAS